MVLCSSVSLRNTAVRSRDQLASAPNSTESCKRNSQVISLKNSVLKPNENLMLVLRSQPRPFLVLLRANPRVKPKLGLRGGTEAKHSPQHTPRRAPTLTSEEGGCQ